MKRVAIVTAGSKGMGLAITRKFKEEGYELFIMSRGEAVLEVADSLNIRAIQGSTANEEDLKRLVDATMAEYGRVDVVVNNTGHSAKGDLLKLTDLEWQEGFELLLMNTIRMARLVTPIMERNAYGSIINISTFGAVEPSLSFPISSVARAALSSYTKLYVQQYASSGIRMNNVLPGFINSYPSSEEIIQEIPAHRQGTTEEIAEVVAFLASEKASYINGQNILVDGGLTRSV